MGFNSRNHNISVMFSRLPKDRTLEGKIDEKYKKYSPHVPHLLQAQQALALLYAKVAGRPSVGPCKYPFGCSVGPCRRRTALEQSTASLADECGEQWRLIKLSLEHISKEILNILLKMQSKGTPLWLRTQQRPRKSLKLRFWSTRCYVRDQKAKTKSRFNIFNT